MLHTAFQDTEIPNTLLSQKLLYLARPLYECPISSLHGPGLRYVFWVQGCSVKCTDQCIHPKALETSDHLSISVAEAYQMIMKRIQGRQIQGITVLGG